MANSRTLVSLSVVVTCIVSAVVDEDFVVPELDFLEARSAGALASQPFVGMGMWWDRVAPGSAGRRSYWGNYPVKFSSTPSANQKAGGQSSGSLVIDNPQSPAWSATGTYSGCDIAVTFKNGVKLKGSLQKNSDPQNTQYKKTEILWSNGVVWTRKEPLSDNSLATCNAEKVPSNLPAKQVVQDLTHPGSNDDEDEVIKKDFKKDSLPADCKEGPFVSTDATIDPITKVFNLGCSRRRIGAGFHTPRYPQPAKPPTPAKPEYVHSKGIACPASYEKIYDAKVCGKAANALNIIIAGPEKPNTNIPKNYHACQFAGGCAVDNKFQKQNKGKVVFNLDRSERCDKGFQSGEAVCQLTNPPVMSKIAPGVSKQNAACKTDVGQNFRGPGGNEDVRKDSATDAAACSAKCTAEAACQYYVFVKGGDCWLKKNYTHKKTCATCTSGLKCSVHAVKKIAKASLWRFPWM